VGLIPSNRMQVVTSDWVNSTSTLAELTSHTFPFLWIS